MFPRLPPGQDGEVTTEQMTEAIGDATGGLANNPGEVALLDFSISAPPTQSEVQALYDKINELISALKRG